MAAGGSFIAARFTDKGTGNNSAHTVLTDEHFSCNFAIFIEGINGNDILMGGNLENAVCRGINDKIACFYVLIAIVLYNLGTGIRLIADNSSACLFRKLLDYFGRKSVGIGRKGIF